MKTTKKSLLLSGASLLLSAALLAGSTFAWFTDSVTNTGNRITSGVFDIALNEGTESPLFSSESFVWEPGRSQMEVATVSNEGSLWLKYTMSFSNVKLTNADGVTSDITKVLDVYKVEGKSATAADLTSENRLGTMNELMKQGYFAAKDDILAPKGQTGSVDNVEYDDTDSFTIVIKMQESAGNEYQNAGVSFDILVNAAQYTYEEDGFGNNQYDKDAEWAVSTEAELETALQNAQDGDTIAFTGDIGLTKILSINKNVTIDGMGNGIISTYPVYVNGSGITLKDITFKDPVNGSNNASSIYVTNNATEKVVIDGCTFNDAQWDAIQLTSNNIKEVTITNNVFKNTTAGYRYIHLEPRNGSAYAAVPDAKLVITGNTFTNVSNAYVKDSAITITGFSFENMTIEGNTFNGKGSDNLTTSILWICNGTDFSVLLPVSEIIK